MSRIKNALHVFSQKQQRSKESFIAQAQAICQVVVEEWNEDVALGEDGPQPQSVAMAKLYLAEVGVFFDNTLRQELGYAEAGVVEGG